MNRFDHFAIWVGALGLRAMIALWGATFRVKFLDGEQRLDELVERGAPMIISFWHDRLFFFAHHLGKRVVRGGFGLTVMSSHSRDGELGAKLARLWGHHIVRGSTSRGGTQGLRAMYHALRRRGSSPIVIPDGPHGPRYLAKPGAIVLAQICRVPIVPMACAVDRCWHVDSWDRLIVPKPFARIRVVVGAPIEIPAELSPEALECERMRLETILNELIERVEAD